MQQWRGPADPPDDFGPCAVTIGMFDGVHRGHQRTFSHTRQVASDLSLPVVLVTFAPHPDEVIRPGSHPPLLCGERHESQLLAEQGVDAVWTIPFTPEFSRLGADEFVRSVLVNRLHSARVVVGENFRFGHKAAGDLTLLEELGDKYDFTVVGVPLLANGQTPISSTGIRGKLAAGNVLDAAHDLGRPHRIEGAAAGGYPSGRMLGFPKADVETPPYTAIPADGVYAGWLANVVDGWQAVISIGTDPADKSRRTVEAYALDHDDLDLYGTSVVVDFISRLRAPMHFSSIDGLVAQMRKDADDARRSLIA